MSDESSIEQELLDDEVNNNEFLGSNDGVTSDVDDIVDDDGSDDDSSKSSNSAWYVSRLEGGQLRDIHIKKALKLLIPREFISRNRSQRHISSKYLPGFEVIEKSHHIVLFCDIVLKAQFQRKKAYKVGRIISLRTDQGKNLVSTSSKSKTVKIRCLIYQKSSGYYGAPLDMGITEWKSVSCVLKVLSLKFVEEKGLQLNLEDEDCLRQMGMCPFEDLEAASVDTEHESDSSAEDIQIPLSDESDPYYEVDTVLDRRFDKDTHMVQYRVRFKGYGSEDDMWLPENSFNCPVNFQSVSSFGRKCKRRSLSHSSNQNLSNMKPSKVSRYQAKTKTSHASKKPKLRKSVVKAKKNCRKSNAALLAKVAAETMSSSESDNDISSPLKVKKRQLTVSSSDSEDAIVGPLKVKKSALTVSSSDSDLNNISSMKVQKRVLAVGSSDSEQSLVSPLNVEKRVLLVDSGNDSDTKSGDLAGDLFNNVETYHSSRYEISKFRTPTIKQCDSFMIEDGTFVANFDPLKLSCIPPYSVFADAWHDLRKKIDDSHSDDFVIHFIRIGRFGYPGCIVLSNIFKFIKIKSDFQEELKWMQQKIPGISDDDCDYTIDKLLYTGSPSKRPLARLQRISLYMRDVICLVGERYVNDQIINYFFQRFEQEHSKGKIVIFDSFLCEEHLPGDSSGYINSSIRNLCSRVDVNQVKKMLIPVNMQQQHWGLLVIDTVKKVFLFDDGFHLPVPDKVPKTCKLVIEGLEKESGLKAFKSDLWDYKKFHKFGMPDQPGSSCSCGVAIILDAKSFFLERPFTWTYYEMGYWRRKLITEILGQQSMTKL